MCNAGAISMELLIIICRVLSFGLNEALESNIRFYVQALPFVTLMLGSIAYMLLNLKKTPITGRWRLLTISREDMMEISTQQELLVSIAKLFINL